MHVPLNHSPLCGESLLRSGLSTSWPASCASCRPSTSCSTLGEKGVDGRVKPVKPVKPGHDVVRTQCDPERPLFIGTPARLVECRRTGAVTALSNGSR